MQVSVLTYNRLYFFRFKNIVQWTYAIPLMNKKQTRPLNLEHTMVAYRCSCGIEFSVSMESGGVCPSCSRSISGQALQNDHLSVTTTLSSIPSDRLGQTRVDEDANTANIIDLAGRSMGHFEILEPLGQGGQGFVYRGLDKSLQRYVAVKVLQRSASENVISNDVDHLLQEAVSQARVTHPNIVTIYYVGKEQGEPFSRHGIGFRLSLERVARRRIT